MCLLHSLSRHHRFLPQKINQVLKKSDEQSNIIIGVFQCQMQHCHWVFLPENISIVFSFLFSESHFSSSPIVLESSLTSPQTSLLTRLPPLSLKSVQPLFLPSHLTAQSQPH